MRNPDGREWTIAAGFTFVDHPVFTDDPLQAGSTPMKVVHLTELRLRIDQLRDAWSLGAFPWTDATIGGGHTVIKAIHMTEMRAAIAAVYTAAGRTAPSFSPPTITVGATVVSAAQIGELRRRCCHLSALAIASYLACGGSTFTTR